MADALLSLIAHPLSVVAHILGQALVTLPGCQSLLRFTLRLPFGVDWWPISEHWRDLDHGLADQHGDRVQVGRVRLQAEALGLERECSTASEWIVESRKPAAIEELVSVRVIGVVG